MPDDGRHRFLTYDDLLAELTRQHEVEANQLELRLWALARYAQRV